jgi:hypothetical protein
LADSLDLALNVGVTFEAVMHMNNRGRTAPSRKRVVRHIRMKLNLCFAQNAEQALGRGNRFQLT